jgi:fructose/tagatose bisphosphate aldolase
MMRGADQGGYAIGYFESWNMESLQGVIDAAEQTNSPVIIGFNGEFLSESHDADVSDLKLYAAIGLAAAATATVPVGFIFNECKNVQWTEQAIGLGFTLVMPAPGTSRPEVNRLSSLAHKRGIAIEAEADHGDGDSQGATDPAAARAFVEATKVDLLAVEVGNEEIKLIGRAPLDIDRLRAIRSEIALPLVLHGGTGIEDASLRQAIENGVRKVNYGTYLKQAYLRNVRELLASDESNPHALLGGGGETDIVVAGRNIVREAVLERIDLLGCCGRA